MEDSLLLLEQQPPVGADLVRVRVRVGLRVGVRVGFRLRLRVGVSRRW